MLQRPIVFTTLAAAALFAASCGSHSDAPILAGDTQSASAEGESLYQEAKRADEAGKTDRAIKLYDRMATRYSFAPSAAEARFRQARLLDQQGETEDAFEAYDDLLQRFPESPQYGEALRRQAAMAQAAADGDLKSSFLGMKTKLSIDKTVAMLGKVRDHAPKSPTAAQAQFSIGEAYLAKRKYKEAIAAFRKLVNDQPASAQAPEALFRVGRTLMENADRGNRNQANLDLAREAFNDYLIQYPGHSRNAEARKMLGELDHWDLKRSYDIAEFYMETGRPESAKIYYRDIVKRAGSGPLYNASKARLKELGE